MKLNLYNMSLDQRRYMVLTNFLNSLTFFHESQTTSYSFDDLDKKIKYNTCPKTIFQFIQISISSENVLLVSFSKKRTCWLKHLGYFRPSYLLDEVSK